MLSFRERENDLKLVNIAVKQHPLHPFFTAAESIYLPFIGSFSSSLLIYIETFSRHFAARKKILRPLKDLHSILLRYC